MAAIKERPALFLAFLCCFSVTLAGEYCTTSGSFWSTTYCTNNCCGTYPNEYCCTSLFRFGTSKSSYVSPVGSINVGVYVGASFGAIVVFCVLVAIICACIKNGQRGRVIVGPVAQPGNNVTVVSANTSQQNSSNAYGQPMGAQQMQPTPYGPAVPPPYSYSNPAYPPTQHAAPGLSDPFATAAFSAKS